MTSKQGHQNELLWFRGLLAGPVAGVCSRIFVYPTDTIKARLQLQGALTGHSHVTYRSTWHAFQEILAKEGVQGLYKGFTAVAVGNIPANLAYFGGYELGKQFIPQSQGVVGDMAVGAIAQLIGGLAFTPVDIIKERMQVQALMQSSYSYSGPWRALQALVQDKGMTGLFKGYWATNAVWIPWNMLYIAAYEESKRSAAALLGCDVQSLPAWALGIASAGSAGAAAVLTHPADVVKTRLQVLSATKESVHLTAWSIAQHMMQREGPAAFMKGVTARVLTVAPGAALSWMIYEPVKRLLSGTEV